MPRPITPRPRAPREQDVAPAPCVVDQEGSALGTLSRTFSSDRHDASGSLSGSFRIWRKIESAQGFSIAEWPAPGTVYSNEFSRLPATAAAELEA